MISIVRAKAEQLEAIVALFEAYRIWYGQAAAAKEAKTFLSERIEKEESHIYLAQDSSNGQYCGFVQLYPIFSSTRMRRVWLLNDLFVEENYRGKGISRMLIDRAKELARATDAAGLLLETQKTNTIGNNLYPATGFELEDKVNFYFWTNK